MYSTYYEHIRGIECKRRHLRKGIFADGSCVLLIELDLLDCRKWFDKLWIVVGRKITEPNYRTRISSQRQRDYFLLRGWN